MNGMEMMISALIKSLGLNPEELKSKASEIHQLVVDINTRFQKMEADITFLKERLNDNGQREPIALPDEFAVGSVRLSGAICSNGIGDGGEHPTQRAGERIAEPAGEVAKR